MHDLQDIKGETGSATSQVLGIENAAALFGDFRDWATCWHRAWCEQNAEMCPENLGNDSPTVHPASRSMKRFHPLEVFIWKAPQLLKACSASYACLSILTHVAQVEGLPSARLHSPNDVFCEADSGKAYMQYVLLITTVSIYTTTVCKLYYIYIYIYQYIAKLLSYTFMYDIYCFA